MSRWIATPLARLAMTRVNVKASWYHCNVVRLNIGPDWQFRFQLQMLFQPEICSCDPQIARQ